MIISKSIRRIWILGFEIVVCIIVGLIASNAMAAQVTLAWDPNTESDLAGYRVHYGTASGSYTSHTDVHNVTSYTVTGLTAGQTYYFAATAYDASGNESGYSNPLSYAVPAANGAPTDPATRDRSRKRAGEHVQVQTSATDPNGDSLQYRYDWGGGVLSGWGAASQSHSWAAAGQYAVKARARDSLGLASAWSGAKTVTISAKPRENQEPPAMPAPIRGSSRGVNGAVSGTRHRSGNGDEPSGGARPGDPGDAFKRGHRRAAQIRRAQHSHEGPGRLTLEVRVPDAAASSSVDTGGRGRQSTDSNGDGVPDSQDAFPNDPKEWAGVQGWERHRRQMARPPRGTLHRMRRFW